MRHALCCSIFDQQDTGNEISKGFSDAGPRIAQGDLILQHAIQHVVAQPDLLRPFRHASLGQ